MKHAIHLHSVGHYFDTDTDRISLFQDIDVCFETGKSYAIVGPSGAGKSSLLTLAAGLEEPRSGSITVTVDQRRAGGQELRQRSGFIFQQFHLLPELDALGNLALPLRIKGDSSALEKARVWLKKIGLQGRAGHKPSQLSGGEQQRVAIARAFIAEPAFIFADEPTGNLDEKTASAISDLMFDCAAERSCAVIVVTHSRALAERASRRFHLEHGELKVVK